MAIHATIRRYDAVDDARINEVVTNAKAKLLPRVSELPGFQGYYLIEAGNGIVSSVGFFDTAEQAEQSTRVAANWVLEKLEKALPNRPKITSGKVVAHTTREPRRGVTAPRSLWSASRPARAGLLVRCEQTARTVPMRPIPNAGSAIKGTLMPRVPFLLVEIPGRNTKTLPTDAPTEMLSNEQYVDQLVERMEWALVDAEQLEEAGQD